MVIIITEGYNSNNDCAVLRGKNIQRYKKLYVADKKKSQT